MLNFENNLPYKSEMTQSQNQQNKLHNNAAEAPKPVNILPQIEQLRDKTVKGLERLLSLHITSKEILYYRNINYDANSEANLEEDIAIGTSYFGAFAVGKKGREEECTLSLKAIFFIMFSDDDHRHELTKKERDEVNFFINIWLRLGVLKPATNGTKDNPRYYLPSVEMHAVLDEILDDLEKNNNINDSD